MTSDIPNMFVQTPVESTNEEMIIMKICGELSVILTNLDQWTYQEYLNNENGTPILHVFMNKAYMGCLHPPCYLTES